MAEKCIVSVQVSSTIIVEGSTDVAKKKFLENLRSKLNSDFRVDEKSLLISNGLKVS